MVLRWMVALVGLTLGCSERTDEANVPDGSSSGVHASPGTLSETTVPPRPSGKLPEVQVSTAPIVDYEFDWGRDGEYCADCNFGNGNNRLTFTDRDDQLWVAHVDPVTGAFNPPSGKGELVDTDAAFAKSFGNGPEWVFGTGASQITYTKYFPGLPHVVFTGCIALATMDSDGWQAGILDGGLEKQSPMGTVDVTDPHPGLTYQALGKVFWRLADDPSSEQQIQLGKKGGGSSRRWVNGTHQIVYTSAAEPDSKGVSYQQVYLYDTVTTGTEQLTFDPVNKTGAFMWRAPEFDNDWVFFTIWGRSALGVYRKIDDGSGHLAWALINKITMPTEVPYVWSPEPFVYKNRSWIFTQVSASSVADDFSSPNHLALTGIDPAHPNLRMLTNDNDVKRVRNDPEFYITANGPYIYYNRYVPKSDTQAGANDGVWRVDTYLGPL